MKWHINENPPEKIRILARIVNPDYANSPFYYMVVRVGDEVVEAGGEGYWSFWVNDVQAWITEEEIDKDFKLNFEF